MVMAARDSGDRERAAAALEALCRAYWYPLYAWARRSGQSAADAEDLTQGFFLQLLERGDFAGADAARGRLRSFLLGAMKHYMADAWDKSRALKRGGGAQLIAIDGLAAEERYRLEPSDPGAPDVLFERRWALTVLEQFIAALREEYAASGKSAVFDALSPWLSGTPGGGYGAAAAKLGVSEGTARVAVHRLRKRYAEVMRREIARTVGSDDDVEDELRALLAALQPPSH
jgi:RNA polymerase sigma-70 factor (ECF subfamily)